MTQTIDIRLAKSAGERDAIYRLRYLIYVEEMGRVQKYADPIARTIVEPLDKSGLLLGAWADDQLVGTVRTNAASDGNLGHYPALYRMAVAGPFNPARTSITTKLMVLPEYRGSMVGLQLCRATYRLLRRRRVAFDFIDCNPHLEALYRKMGYRYYTDPIDHPEYGVVMPMVLATTDQAHLDACGSPLRGICREFAPERQSPAYLYQHILPQPQQQAA